MAAGIQTYDIGYVEGDTWHRNPKYIRLNRPVTPDEARKVMAFECHKSQLFRKNKAGEFIPAFAWEIVRTNEDIPLVPHIGKKFNEGSNLEIFDGHILPILKEFPQLHIESVGTLWNGTTTFVNLLAKQYRIPHDQSDTMNRILWFNPMGYGGYKITSHSLRVVCNNTLMAAWKQGEAAGKGMVISHTQNADAKIGTAIEKVAAEMLKLESQQEVLTMLTGQKMTSASIKAFFAEWLPMPDNSQDRALTMRVNAINKVTEQFNSDQGLDIEIKASGYALLQAVTFVLDHDKINRGNDNASLIWDNLVGGRASKKLRAFNILANYAGVK